MPDHRAAYAICIWRVNKGQYQESQAFVDAQLKLVTAYAKSKGRLVRIYQCDVVRGYSLSGAGFQRMLSEASSYFDVLCVCNPAQLGLSASVLETIKQRTGEWMAIEVVDMEGVS